MTAKRTKGLTLLELVIALAVWLVLSAGVFFLWQHTSAAGINLLDHQSALENARGAMDALLANIEHAGEVRVTTRTSSVLYEMVVPGYRTVWRNNGWVTEWHEFRFNFNNFNPIPESYQRLNFGDNELARGIAAIYISRTPLIRPYRTIHVEIHTICYVESCRQPNCDHPIILHGSVDVRHKDVLFNP